MLQFRNSTGFAGTLFGSPDPDGVDSLYTVVKGTFDLARGLEPAQEQVPVTLAPEHHGDPAASSLRVPSDVSLIKPGTDVLLTGHAYAPGGRPAAWMDVSLAVGGMIKWVRVFGDRVWQSNGVGHTPSHPRPFEVMPLVWERAYGGTEEVEGGVRGEARNPVGVGFRAPESERPLEGSALPNLEDPADPITSWKQSPPPACFAAVAPHWEPRRSFAGTYDAGWQKRRAPYLPEDFDARFFQLAPPGMVAGGYLQGGETVDVGGATPSGALRFRLPDARVRVTCVLDSGRDERMASLDTVLIEPDASRVILVWRATFRCDKKLLRVREVVAERVRHP